MWPHPRWLQRTTIVIVTMSLQLEHGPRYRTLACEARASLVASGVISTIRVHGSLFYTSDDESADE